MTTNHNTKDILNHHHLKATPQRIAVLTYLMTHENHPTAEMIHHELSEISLATIYNTLEKLVAAELVITIDQMDDGKRHYDYYGDPHYHIINPDTQEIIDADNFDMAPLFEAARAASGWLISGYHVEVYGKPADRPE